MRTPIIVFTFALALIVAVGSRASAQSGLVEQTCNHQQAQHYTVKAMALMRGQSWATATWALSAAWDSQAKCASETRNPLWAYWWNLSFAAVTFNLRLYDKSLRFLSQADSWQPIAKSYATATKQLAAYGADEALAASIRSATAARESQPRIVTVPRPYYYAAPGGAPSDAGCDEDSIETVGDDGGILVMLSGAVYRVADYDTVTSSLWLATEDVLICGSRMVNKDDDGEAVDVSRVR